MSAIVIPFPKRTSVSNQTSGQLIEQDSQEGLSQDELEELAESIRAPEPGESFGDKIYGDELTVVGIRLEYISMMRSVTECLLVGHMRKELGCLLIVKSHVRVANAMLEVGKVIDDSFGTYKDDGQYEPLQVPMVKSLTNEFGLDIGEAFLFRCFDYVRAAKWASTHGWSIASMMNDVERHLCLLCPPDY